MAFTIDIDGQLGTLLIDASIQAYSAFDSDDPGECRLDRVVPPPGFAAVDTWTGFNSVIGSVGRTECFGVVFRSESAPYTYIFSFRGTYSILDALEDASFWELDTFLAYGGGGPSQAKVGSGFWSLYSSPYPPAGSMQAQVFALLAKYVASGEPISRLLITGHSLGAALAQLFTLDVAFSEYRDLPYVSYNYASPRVGDHGFARAFDAARSTLRVQNTYDLVPCAPPATLFGYQHAGDAYLLAFYGDVSWIDPLAKYYDHQALNYQLILNCAVASSNGVCVGRFSVDTGAGVVVSVQPDPATVCSWWQWSLVSTVEASDVSEANPRGRPAQLA